ncbi:MAG: carbohydrate ABC transporter permease [Clostridia bacterium]|nr:carbohydrate ABC transporter permease [Clostridia bacterium]
MRKNTGSLIVTYVFIAVLMIIYLFPLFYVFNTSIKSKTEYIQNTLSIASSFRYENYIEAFNRANFASFIGNSVFYMVVCTVLSIMMAVFLAFPISRNYIKFSNAIYLLFIAGLFLPDATIPQFQMLLKAGLYNTRLGYMLGLMGGGGIPLFFFVSYLKNIPRDFDEAASIDGCGYFRYIFQILIPLMKPAIASMAILSAIGVWNDVIRAIIYLSNKSLFPITRGLHVFTGQYQNDTTLQMAALVMVAAPLLILYLFLQRYIIDGAVAGAIKA